MTLVSIILLIAPFSRPNSAYERSTSRMIRTKKVRPFEVLFCRHYSTGSSEVSGNFLQFLFFKIIYQLKKVLLKYFCLHCISDTPPTSSLCLSPTLLKARVLWGGGEQYWPAPRGNPCSIFFSGVDFVLFLDFFGGVDSSLLGLQYCAVMDVVRNIVNVYKKILKCSQKCLL